MRRTLIFMVLLGIFAISATAKEHSMQHAKVLNQQMNSEDNGAVIVPLNGMLVGVPISNWSNVITIESPDGRTISTLRQTDKHPLILNVGGEASFYLDGDKFCFPDSKGKKHTFVLMHMETRP
jgi:hypothetical protein